MSKGISAKALEAALLYNEIPYSFFEPDGQDGDVCIFHFSADAGKMFIEPIRALIVADDRSNLVCARANLPVMVDVSDAELTARIGRLIARINWNSANLSFALDYSNGEIHCQWNTSTKGLETVPDTIAANAVLGPLTGCTSYAAAFAKVLYGGVDPDDVFEKQQG